MTATDGTTPYSWSATGLPDGLSMGSNGTITGTPTTAGTYTVGVTVHDSGGLTATANLVLTVNPPPDTVPPATALTLSGTAGNNGWYVSDVQAALTAEDNPGGSGVAKTEYSFDGVNWVTYSAPFTMSTEGTTKVYYRSTDNANNTETTKEQVINIDKTAPQILINLPADGGQYNLGQQITADWQATDSLSGLQSATGTTPSGSIIDTATVGVKTYKVTAIDQAGNEASKTVSYQVTYVYSGILQPADGKVCKLGSTVPVKFWLKDDAGNFVNNAVAELSVAKITDGNAQDIQPVYQPDFGNYVLSWMMELYVTAPST